MDRGALAPAPAAASPSLSLGCRPGLSRESGRGAGPRARSRPAVGIRGPRVGRPVGMRVHRPGESETQGFRLLAASEEGSRPMLAKAGRRAVVSPGKGDWEEPERGGLSLGRCGREAAPPGDE